MPEKEAGLAFKGVRSIERTNRNWEKSVVDTYACLASVAQLEFETLVAEAQSAIQGLQRQRQSVMEAIQAVQPAHGHYGPYPLETMALMMALREKLRRLNAALDQVQCELEGTVANPLPAAPDPDAAVAPSPGPETLSPAAWSGCNRVPLSQEMVGGGNNGNGRR